MAARTMDAGIVVNIQGDEPMIPPEMIDETIRLVADNPSAVAGTVVRRITKDEDLTNPNIVKVVISLDNRALYFSRAPIPFVRDNDNHPGIAGRQHYYRHHGLYVYRAAFLQTYASLPPTPLELSEKLEQLRILEHGYSIHVAVTQLDSISVDTPADLERAAALMKL
jgi:3-deoxy-manno-octulosonate cytidylyltransferase (CMP-KDO synthetase)